jgi:hypothetical protein
LQVHQHADRPADALLDGADRADPGAVILVCAVAEVQAENVDPSLEQGFDLARRRGGRPERGDDLGGALAANGRELLKSPGLHESR